MSAYLGKSFSLFPRVWKVWSTRQNIYWFPFSFYTIVYYCNIPNLLRFHFFPVPFYFTISSPLASNRGYRRPHRDSKYLEYIPLGYEVSLYHRVGRDNSWQEIRPLFDHHAMLQLWLQFWRSCMEGVIVPSNCFDANSPDFCHHAFTVW